MMTLGGGSSATMLCPLRPRYRCSRPVQAGNYIWVAQSGEVAQLFRQGS